MPIVNLFFYLFSFVAILSAFMVIGSRNPVHSVFFLILTFLNSAGLFMLMGAEFLALVLILTYVGAVLVLFVFVIMMLDLRFLTMEKSVLKYLPVGGSVGLILLIELIAVFSGNALDSQELVSAVQPIPNITEVSNIKALGNLLYTRYILFFQLSGIILLIGMVGAIVLTLHHKRNIYRQDVESQVERDPHDSVILVSVKPNEGI
ncbi:NADH-quinone oxidoreductase subunit J [Candidatus Endowatersipora endosymbiont of Watersipora subatra]|uniref:NADH-quinone oxidoreductase subunit J n=1 Tax=Candidatus Endowatersipora endosymbiont of Watersipora subatra TaxID=3077946 RepID=UPI00312CB1AA